MKPGFDFLGFNIRQYKVSKHQSGKLHTGEILGFKTIIKPSNDSVKKHYQNLSNQIKMLNAATQAILIKELNPIIRGWGNYFKTVCSKDTFSKLNHLIHRRLHRWGNRRHAKVQEARSPYDGGTLYWAKRKGNHPELKSSIR